MIEVHTHACTCRQFCPIYILLCCLVLYEGCVSTSCQALNFPFLYDFLVCTLRSCMHGGAIAVQTIFSRLTLPDHLWLLPRLVLRRLSRSGMSTCMLSISATSNAWARLLESYPGSLRASQCTAIIAIAVYQEQLHYCTVSPIQQAVLKAAAAGQQGPQA